MTKKKQKIKCEVESCVHQNTDEQVCELDEIKVSSCKGCGEDEVVENEETVCESFDCDEDSCNCEVADDNDDEEYEVEEETEYEEYEDDEDKEEA